MELSLNDNKYTKRMPAYVQSYTQFMTFCKYLTSYMNSYTSTVKTIADVINSRGEYRNDHGDLAYSRNVLGMLCSDLGITYVNHVSESDLNTAIKALSFRSTSFSTLNDVLDVVPALSSVLSSVSVRDRSILPKDNADKEVMSIDIDIIGNKSTEDSANWAFIFEQILPNITGVKINSSYSGGVVFAFDNDQIKTESGEIDSRYGGWDEGSWKIEQLK